MEKTKKKVLFLITKSNWGDAPRKPLGFPTLASLTAFRHGEPAGFLTGTVHSLDNMLRSSHIISMSLAKLQAFASHPTPYATPPQFTFQYKLL